MTLGVLALTTFLLVWHHARYLSRTPWWLLWLVLMLPGLVVGVWVWFHGEEQAMPAVLVVMPFLLSGVFYFLLVRQGGGVPRLLTETLPAPLTPAEMTHLHQCFPWELYALQRIDQREGVVVCAGRLRGNAATAYRVVAQNIQAQLGQRFWLILAPNADQKPYFALVPRRMPAPRPDGWVIGVTSLGLGLWITRTVTAPYLGIAQPLGWGYGVGVLAILLAREVGQRWGLRSWGGKSGWPWLIPLPCWPGVLGTYSGITEPLPDRRALVDRTWLGVGLALAVTLGLLLWGLGHSPLTPGGFLPHHSYLLWVVSRWVWGDAMTAGMGLHLHPVAWAGVVGLGLLGIQLTPVGRLDGGCLLHALVGRRGAQRWGWVTKALVLLLGWQVQPWLRGWGVLLLFIPTMPPLVLNEVTELDSQRDGLGLLGLGLFLAIILPAPGFLPRVG